MNLKLYHPDTNESRMLLEAMEDSVHKIAILCAKDSSSLHAEGALQFVRSSYLLCETYTPEIIGNAISQIIESDKSHLEGDELMQASRGLTQQLNSIILGLSEIEKCVTVMYRSVPIHYRVGYIFRNTSAKTARTKLISLSNCLKGLQRSISK